MFLSACPLVFRCAHQLLFPCLEVYIQGSSPPRAVSCEVLPAGIGFDVKCLHATLCRHPYIVAVDGQSSSQMPAVHSGRLLGRGQPPCMRWTYASQRSLRCFSRAYMLGRPARNRTLALDAFSCQDHMPRIRRKLLRWKVLSRLSCLAYVAHVSLPYGCVLETQALYTAIFVSPSASTCCTTINNLWLP